MISCISSIDASVSNIVIKSDSVFFQVYLAAKFCFVVKIYKSILLVRLFLASGLLRSVSLLEERAELVSRLGSSLRPSL